MFKFLAHRSILELFYIISAIIGGILVLIRFILQVIGSDADGSDGFDIHSDSDTSFNFLSLHGLSSFMLMFGLVGLALYSQSSVSSVLSMVGAVTAGVISVFIIGQIFKMFGRMQTSGNILIDSTIGNEGTVYAKIPKNGIGQVTVNVKNHLREFEARSNNGEEILSGELVKVVKVIGKTLVVERTNYVAVTPDLNNQNA